MAEERKKRKGDNKSIRFEPTKYSFVCSEEKLETPQEVVDFLMDKYWWEKKIGNPPTLERQNVPRGTLSVQQHPLPSLPKLNQVQAYQSEIMGAGSPSEIQRIVNLLKKDDSLTKPEQIRLEQFGIQRSKEIDF